MEKTALKDVNLITFSGTETARKEISYPVGTRWVKGLPGSYMNRDIATNYWTCIPLAKFKKNEWVGCVTGKIANMMVTISVYDVVGPWNDESELIDSRVLMEQFDLLGRVIVGVAEIGKTFALTQVARITDVESPERVTLTQHLFRTFVGTGRVMRTEVLRESLADISGGYRDRYWYLLPRDKGAGLWKTIHSYVNSLYNGEDVTCPYELECEFKVDDLSKIGDIIARQHEFVGQFGIVPGVTHQLNF